MRLTNACAGCYFEAEQFALFGQQAHVPTCPAAWRGTHSATMGFRGRPPARLASCNVQDRGSRQRFTLLPCAPCRIRLQGKNPDEPAWLDRQFVAATLLARIAISVTRRGLNKVYRSSTYDIGSEALRVCRSDRRVRRARFELAGRLPGEPCGLLFKSHIICRDSASAEKANATYGSPMVTATWNKN